MTALEMPYLTGQKESTGGPLSRFLPNIPLGIAPAWLAGRAQPGAWVLDPFGASPQLSLEAARAGYRVLAAVNSPVTRFILEALAAGLQPTEFQASLAELAASHKGDERLELHIQSLYLTTCECCNRPIPARAFLWERGAKQPYARLYICPHCGDEGERPLQPADLERLSGFGASALSRARALERVAALDDPARADVEEALNCYLPRSLYALFTLLNKLDGLALSPRRRTVLTALLLSVCDQANTLWTYPTARARPRQLAVPPRFRENNLWFALEDAAAEWTRQAAELVRVCYWPEQLDGPGICLFQGRLRDLAADLPSIPIQAIVAALPRPNQAFWTLSALWSGWIWGREAVAPLKSVLARRRYDWNWHTTALEAVLSHLAGKLAPAVPFFGLLGDVEPAFLSAAVLSAAASGFQLEAIALSGDSGPAQITWTSQKQASPPADPLPLVRSALAVHLRRRGEPAGYLPLHTSALASLGEAGGLRLPPAAEPLPHLQGLLKQAFTDPTRLVHYGGEHSLESGSWWLAEPGDAEQPLADRVEMALVRGLIKEPGRSSGEIIQSLHADFPGLLTPSPELIQVCLESYGEQDPPGSGRWRLRAQEAPAVRRADLAEMQALLQQLGERLGYRTQEEGPYRWLDPQGGPAFQFYLIASTVVGSFIHNPDVPTRRCLVVLPGSRANLLSYKVRQNPRLAQAIAAGWRFIKFRHLRSLADNALLNREAWLQQIDRDPPEYVAAQMNLF